MAEKTDTPEDRRIREQVRTHYSAAATAVLDRGATSREGVSPQGLRDAGFVSVAVVLTHEMTDGIHGAIIQARKPEDQLRTGRDAPSHGGIADHDEAAN